MFNGFIEGVIDDRNFPRNTWIHFSFLGPIYGFLGPLLWSSIMPILVSIYYHIQILFNNTQIYLFLPPVQKVVGYYLFWHVSKRYHANSNFMTWLALCPCILLLFCCYWHFLIGQKETPTPLIKVLAPRQRFCDEHRTTWVQWQRSAGCSSSWLTPTHSLNHQSTINNQQSTTQATIWC